MKLTREIEFTAADIKAALLGYAEKVSGGPLISPTVEFQHPKQAEPWYYLQDLKVIIRG